VKGTSSPSNERISVSPTSNVAVTTRPVPQREADGIKPMRRDAARNRALLLSAARTVCAQRGMEASLDDVARQAGLGVGTAYRHFANKYELWSALMDELVADFLASAESMLAVERPWDALVGFLERAVEMQANDRGLREVLLGFHDTVQFDAARTRIEAVLVELVGRARAAGVVRADAQPSDVGVLITMLCAAADLTGDEAPQLWRRYLAVCLEGLRPSPIPLPEQALTEAQLRLAMTNYKQAVARS
jgi:AcrR family transcriptional regulator